MADFEPGQTITIQYPFVRDEYEDWDTDGPVKMKTWKPGIRVEPRAPYGEDCEAIADAEGQQIFTIISVHKPGRYPTRIFYIRQWRDPNGKQFGKTRLHIATLEKFRRLSRCYQHDYRVERCAA